MIGPAILRVSSSGEPHMDGYVFGLHVLRSGWACYVTLVLCRRAFAVCVNLGALKVQPQ